MNEPVDGAASIDALAGRLRTRFPDVPPARVRDLVTRVHQQYEDSRIRDFVPMLVEREVADILRAEAEDPAQGSAVN